MDGARFANAVASVGCSPKELTWKAGVDVLCFGGTKNGIGAGELVIFFNRDLAKDFDYRVKQGGQLGSKMRFLAAQWQGLLQNQVWLRNAERANASAKKLAAKLSGEAKLEPLLPVESNSVFVRLTDVQFHDLSRAGWTFYKFIEPDIYRFMCSWATTDEVIDEFVRAVAACRS
jgi:threonine aldolase